MAHAFLLLHNPPETGKVKVIGIYSSEALAGFVNRPDSFAIDRYEIDEDHWTRGFVSL